MPGKARFNNGRLQTRSRQQQAVNNYHPFLIRSYNSTIYVICVKNGLVGLTLETRFLVIDNKLKIRCNDNLNQRKPNISPKYFFINQQISF